MRISAADILATHYGPNALRTPSGAGKGSARAGSAESRKSDSVDISTQARDRLDQIRQRISAGYYNRPDIADDISEKIGNVLDEMVH